MPPLLGSEVEHWLTGLSSGMCRRMCWELAFHRISQFLDWPQRLFVNTAPHAPQLMAGLTFAWRHETCRWTLPPSYPEVGTFSLDQSLPPAQSDPAHQYIYVYTGTYTKVYVYTGTYTKVYVYTGTYTKVYVYTGTYKYILTVNVTTVVSA